jgi:hypothetical protein
VTILDSNGQPLPAISVTPPPTAFEFGGGSTSKDNGNGLDSLRANGVFGVGAKRNGDGVRAMSKHADCRRPDQICEAEVHHARVGKKIKSVPVDIVSQ